MDAFWKTDVGKILSHGIHEHNHGLGRIVRNIELIERTLDNISNKENEVDIAKIKSRLQIIKDSKEKCKDAVDYMYVQTKKKLENDRNRTNN